MILKVFPALQLKGVILNMKARVGSSPPDSLKPCCPSGKPAVLFLYRVSVILKLKCVNSGISSSMHKSSWYGGS